ncbi:hypothetical protein SAMN04488118_103289 [Epibacterium ulvae]|uniref:Uncharacterized protein n=1 Tax=Epibacterium ulvae TaxID=1156985 RepID=A0A1G5Q966_9RHOB|nr:hypothetical protein [Epibacterium ulvae]SCZ58425.1 hypothetical protein SAMN04488118_103289 [Epibacterium ulvae]
MAKTYSKDLIACANYGIDEKIDANTTVQVPLRDLLKVHATLGEFNRFFHQPLHYQTVDQVNEFLGSFDDPRAYKLLHTAYYELLGEMLPDYVNDMFSDGHFDAPFSPYYFKENDGE